MMVLAMLRVLPLKIPPPPPVDAEFPERVELETVAVARL